MGRPKQLLDWHGRPLIVYQIRELQAAGVDHVIAVLGHQADVIRPLAQQAGAEVALNARYREGRAGSIRTGALAAPDAADTIVLLNVDQPRGREITAALLAFHHAAGNLITVPAYGDRRGHPVVLQGRLLPELRGVGESTEGLKAIMRRHADERIAVPFSTDTVLLDLNHPQEYESARALHGW